MSKPATPSDETLHASPLVEFLNALPSPLATTLVGLAPAISRARYTVQVLSWKAPWEDCWLALALWWAVCLIPELGLRYLIPPAAFLAYLRLRSRPPPSNTPPLVTEDTLQRAITDLTTIHALLPSLSSVSSAATVPPFVALLRVFFVLYIPYLFLTYVVRLRILLAICGTIFFTWRARWAAVIRRGLWRSAHVRWATYRAWSALSGQPLPPITLSPQSQTDAELATLTSTSTASTPASPGTSIRFLFTIYENQRWWMGLDWTAALLPGERPSWCSASQQPAAPPSAFTLPAPTTAYTLAPDGRRRLKRTARWHWEEPEWRVVVRREGAGTSRVERPLPSAKEESAAAASASRILKAAGKMRQPSIDAGRVEKERERDGEGERPAEDGVDGSRDEDAEPYTDPDGWVYADNKWEGASAKGGMGKYTRYRRWTRVAVLTETVEIVEPGELGIRRDDPPPPLEGGGDGTGVASPTQAAPPNGNAQPPSRGIAPSQDVPPPDNAASAVIVQPAEDEGSRLRQRLKAAVKGATSHP
ncbi:integral peroxisomal membrane peroxin-domain-containing protein [Trametes polyzona]|nr:integral peroxisomal membrane peroxin-domain-containing protein [Trametes polyzona]